MAYPPPPKPQSKNAYESLGSSNRTDSNGNSGFGATSPKKKKSGITALAESMANTATSPLKVAGSMIGTAGRVKGLAGSAVKSMGGTAGRVGRAINPFD